MSPFINRKAKKHYSQPDTHFYKSYKKIYALFSHTHHQSAASLYTYIYIIDTEKFTWKLFIAVHFWHFTRRLKSITNKIPCISQICDCYYNNRCIKSLYLYFMFISINNFHIHNNVCNHSLLLCTVRTCLAKYRNLWSIMVLAFLTKRNDIYGA